LSVGASSDAASVSSCPVGVSWDGRGYTTGWCRARRLTDPAIPIHMMTTGFFPPGVSPCEGAEGPASV
jgi:hypothetical protein